MSTLEKRLDELASSQGLCVTLLKCPDRWLLADEARNDASTINNNLFLPNCRPSWIGHDFDRLPPCEVVASVVDIFFARCHNQPYFLFHEARFRRRLKNSTLPHFLLLAILALALRFSEDRFFLERGEQAAESYAKLAWEDIMHRWANIDEEENICAVQAMLLLSSFDYTANRRQKAWIKTGVAVRLALDLGLNREPDANLDPVEQEERRRVFWTAYLTDRFATCARGRPPMLRDEDCKLSLPCDESDFGLGVPGPPRGLSSLLEELDRLSLNPSIMSIIAASLLGQCTRYMLEEEKEFDGLSPWDPKSESATIASRLMLFEASFGQGSAIDSVMKDYHRTGDTEIKAMPKQDYSRGLVWGYIYGVIPPSFEIFFFITVFWVIQIQCTMEIIIDHIVRLSGSPTEYPPPSVVSSSSPKAVSVCVCVEGYYNYT
ncbi:fungal-specific transcription factor domain-containing protein [Dactylonectria macrodidyma]|uniref:Fungal-specific transcription factor domain-containing protein n=1 Tax=Dactylonectria macrodidyma TaxID=307937 RepID=A0A9P9D154_9HYPO|nr:fungal-specific transcription factor domain-containing protein [Dactylonectria macrodidyma]